MKGLLKTVKMIALDLDDTLLDSNLTISPYSRSVVRKAMDRGITVVLASGRVPAALESYVKILGLDKQPGYFIAENGAVIQETHTGEIVFEARLPADIALMVYNLADAEGFPVQIYEKGTIFVSRSNEFSEYDQKLTGLRQIEGGDFRDMIISGCTKLIIPGDPMILKPLEILLKTYVGGDATLFTSKPYFLEVLGPGTNKGTALEWVAGQTGVGREAVLAVGDSMNDEAMLRWAGFGAVMRNGDDRLKKLAGAVTSGTNDEDGAADFIERYVLDGGELPD